MDNWIDNLRRIGLKRYGDENRRILSELLRNGIPAGNTVMSEASAEALIIAVAAMIKKTIKHCSPIYRCNSLFFCFALNICLLHF